MRVRDIMTAKVITIAAEKTALVVQEIMDRTHVRHVPVIDQNHRLIGIVSYGDILRASLSSTDIHFAAVERKQYLAQVHVAAVMHRHVRTIGPDALVQEAAGLLRRARIGCLPVVEEDRLVGIVTQYDLLRLVESLPNGAVDSAAFPCQTARTCLEATP